MIKTIISLLEEPIEDGMTHPADRYLRQRLNENSNNLNELTSWYWDNKNAPYVSDVLRLIGRLEKNIIEKEGIKIMNDALKSSEVGIRESAVSALENWGGQDAINILLDYVNSEKTKWLKNYANEVIKDLVNLSLTDK